MLIAALLAATAVIFFARHKRKRKKRARFAERRRLVLVVVDMQKDYDTTANCELYGEVRSPYANDIAPFRRTNQPCACEYGERRGIGPGLPDMDPAEWSLGPAQGWGWRTSAHAKAVFASAKRAAGARLARGYLEAVGVALLPTLGHERSHRSHASAVSLSVSVG